MQKIVYNQDDGSFIPIEVVWSIALCFFNAFHARLDNDLPLSQDDEACFVVSGLKRMATNFLVIFHDNVKDNGCRVSEIQLNKSSCIP